MKFMFAAGDGDPLEFTAYDEDAKRIFIALNLQLAMKRETVCFGLVDGPQFQGTAGSTDAINAIRTLRT